MFYRVFVASQRFHGKESLTYSYGNELKRGQIVEVPLQHKNILGIVDKPVGKPAFISKPIRRSWDISVPEVNLKLLDWLQEYYPAPLGALAELFTPPVLPQKLSLPEPPESGSTAGSLPPLTPDQEAVLKAIKTGGAQSILLHGETGSGKTRVYTELAQQTLNRGRSALILTPEIGLTEPLLNTFTQQFGNQVVVTHSGMTPVQRRTAWLLIATSQKPLVIIGPRSALFSPVKSLGLVVVDECHDGAYKQEQAPYYQASRVAASLARLHKGLLVLGSATPPIEDYYVFQQKNLPILRMENRAIGNEHPAEQIIVDQRDKAQFGRSAWLSTPLLAAVEQALEADEQSLLFLNRRGSARMVLCENCGWQAMCPHCDVPLTFHADQYLMRCHSCDFATQPPSICPECSVSELVFKSIGTKALETELKRLFPRAKISRFDRDSEKAERLYLQYNKLQSGNVDIIVGTQAVAKGFDLPKLSVVGIVHADSGLQIPDFTAQEKSFQLISQVSGRIGRGHRPGKLFVQSYQPDNQLLALALAGDYQGFLKQELSQREHFKFPPYFYLAKVTYSRASSKSAQEACVRLAETIRAGHHSVIIEGPAPRFVERLAGKYAWHLILKAKDRKVLVDIVRHLPGNVIYDLDPNDLL